MIDAAMTDSVRRVGSLTTSKAARDKVIEWATVKAVTTFRMLRNAGFASGTASQW